MKEPNNSDGSVNFLDVNLSINQNNKIIYQHYRKPTRKDLFVNKNSGIVMDSKFNFIKNETQRINNNCHLEADAEYHVSKFNGILQKNGYNNDDISKTTCKAESNNNGSNSRAKSFNKHLYLTIPYVDETTTQIIRRTVMDCGFNVRVSTKNKSLKDIINNKGHNNNNNSNNRTQLCQSRRCNMRSNMCAKKMVVYL